MDKKCPVCGDTELVASVTYHGRHPSGQSTPEYAYLRGWECATCHTLRTTAKHPPFPAEDLRP